MSVFDDGDEFYEYEIYNDWDYYDFCDYEDEDFYLDPWDDGEEEYYEDDEFDDRYEE